MVEYLENFPTNMAVKEFWKSVHICQSYDKKSIVLFFLDTVYSWWTGSIHATATALTCTVWYL